MACVHGRVNPSNQTKLRLFSASGGYCQNPGCLTLLFPEELDGRIHIAEMAHIIAALVGGPRGDDNIPAQDLSRYENMILLCPTCHTIIDSASEMYPTNEIIRWKADHVARLRRAFEISHVNDRSEARALIEPLLTTNREIFNRYGPHNDYGWDLEAEEAAIWRSKMRAQIIPNNQRILLAADENRHLLIETELTVVEAFRQHIDDLVQKHINGLEAVAIQFPAEMRDIYK